MGVALNWSELVLLELQWIWWRCWGHGRFPMVAMLMIVMVMVMVMVVVV